MHKGFVHGMQTWDSLCAQRNSSSPKGLESLMIEKLEENIGWFYLKGAVQRRYLQCCTPMEWELLLVVASYHYCLNRHSAAIVLQILTIA